jgi:hypothetical protein
MGQKNSLPDQAREPVYLLGLQNVEMHRMNTGHFAIEDELDVMAP